MNHKRFTGFVQKQPLEVFCKKKMFLKFFQISQENTCVVVSLLERYSNTDVFQ